MLALLEIPHFTPYVGTAPGTTTIHISGQADLGSPKLKAWWNPYVDIPTMRGLGRLSDTQPRWDLFGVTLALSFASAVTYAWWKSSKVTTRKR